MECRIDLTITDFQKLPPLGKATSYRAMEFYSASSIDCKVYSHLRFIRSELLHKLFAK